jgi:hypothetical protein
MKKAYDNADLVPLLCCIINICPLRTFLKLNKKEKLSFSKEISDIIDKMKDDINIIKYRKFYSINWNSKRNVFLKIFMQIFIY